MTVLRGFNEFESVDLVTDYSLSRASTLAGMAVAGVNRAAMAMDSHVAATAYAEFNLPVSDPLWIHFKKKGAASPSSSGWMLQIRDTDNAEVLGIYTADGSTAYLRYGGTNVYSIGDLTTIRTYDISIKLHATTGYIRFYVDNVMQWELVGNTLGSRTSTTAAKLRWKSLDTSGTAGDAHATILSHVILADTPTLRMRLHTLPLIAETDLMDWTGDVADINGDTLNLTTSMQADSVGQTSTFTHANLPALAENESIMAVIVATMSSYTEGSFVEGQSGVAKISSTVYETATVALTEDTPTPAQHVFPVHPGTLGAWTQSAVNSTLFGIRAKA